MTPDQIATLDRIIERLRQSERELAAALLEIGCTKPSDDIELRESKFAGSIFDPCIPPKERFRK